MPSLYSEIEIAAPKPQVWRTLCQKERWMYWNTFLYDCDPKTPLEPGQRIWLALRRQPGTEETELQALVTVMQPCHYLQWVSRVPGLCCVHTFELQDLGANRTKFSHRESFSGWLGRALWPWIRQAEHQGICRMTWELKQYLEQGGDRP